MSLADNNKCVRSLREVEESHMSMIEGRFHFRPTSDVPSKFYLILQRQNVIVARNIYVKNMEPICLA